MAKHHTRNTVSTTKWCKTCSKMTPHQVADKREGFCLDCYERRQGIAQEFKYAGPTELQLPCMCYRYEFPHFHVSSKPLWMEA